MGYHRLGNDREQTCHLKCQQGIPADILNNNDYFNSFKTGSINYAMMILRVISDKYEQDNKTGPKATGTEPVVLRYIFTEFIELA